MKLLSIGLAAVLVAGCATHFGQKMPSGRTLYEQECAACHGARGIGDGPVARHLLKMPTDLTVLSYENGGDFPIYRVRAAILGDERGEHFSGAMPKFRDVIAHQSVGDAGGVEVYPDLLVERVIAYLKRIQVSG